MYPSFFGFKERPFKLVPDPEYLFLSQCHEDALAHLAYALMSGEGFVELTGEVGTGKTLLCRVFLENLGPDVETAYIFNPAMDARELLATINAEFGIASHHQSTAALIWELNQFLIRQKARGRKSMLLIDEAQSLSRSALEQIRLLTNLETTRDKLLQIVLAGQPELGELLDTYELRQLSQRITLSCRLQPLTLKETEAYIQHRLHVAANKPANVFSKSAIRGIHQFCGGVPRLINIACDRALLAAYSENKPKVSRSIVKTVTRELAGRGDIRQRFISSRRSKSGWAALAAFCLLAGLYLYQSELRIFIPDLKQDKNVSNVKPAKAQTGVRAESAAPSAAPSGTEVPGTRNNSPEPVESPASGGQKGNAARRPLSLEVLPGITAEAHSRQAAAKCLISEWERPVLGLDEFENVAKDDLYFRLLSRRNGLEIHRVDEDLRLIRRLNLPAVLKMQPPAKQEPVYVFVSGSREKALNLTSARSASSLFASYQEIQKYWTGVAYVAWKNFYHYQGIIPLDTSGESVITLKMHLAEIGFPGLSINAEYDGPTRSAVRTLQARHGIPVDGYVGPLTKIVLYNEKPSLTIPRLEKNLIPAATGEGAAS